MGRPTPCLPADPRTPRAASRGQAPYHPRLPARPAGALVRLAEALPLLLYVVETDGRVRFSSRMARALHPQGLPEVVKRWLENPQACGAPLETGPIPLPMVWQRLQPAGLSCALVVARPAPLLSADGLGSHPWQIALETGRFGFLEFDGSTQRICATPHTLSHLLGLPVTQLSLPYEAWLERLHPDDRPLVAPLLSDPQGWLQGTASLEYRVRHANGHWEWVEQRSLLVAATPEAPRILGLCQLVTSRKYAEIELIRREQQFRTLAENTSDIIARYDLNLRCLYINRSVAHYLALRREDHLGKRAGEKGWPKKVAERFEQECRALVATGQPRQYEHEIELNDRRYVFETRLFPEYDRSGMLTSILSIDREVTETRLALTLLAEENRVMEMIPGNQSLAETLEQVCQMIRSQLPHSRVAVLLANEATLQLTLIAQAGLSTALEGALRVLPLSTEDGVGAAAANRQTVVVEDVAASPLWQARQTLAAAEGVCSSWAVPVMTSERGLLGVVALFHGERLTPGASENRLLFRSNHLCAIAIQHDLQQRQLYALATLDGMTGLFNRRHFFETAEREIQRVRRNGMPACAMMMDLDHFKAVNDNFGHACGDLVLRAFADECRRQLRATDLIGRLGGEEFAVLLPDTGLEAAREVAERLRQRVERQPLSTPRGPLHYTVSAGVSALMPGDTSLETLLHRTDGLLYEAKRHGRNQVVADPPPRLR